MRLRLSSFYIFNVINNIILGTSKNTFKVILCNHDIRKEVALSRDE